MLYVKDDDDSFDVPTMNAYQWDRQLWSTPTRRRVKDKTANKEPFVLQAYIPSLRSESMYAWALRELERETMPEYLAELHRVIAEYEEKNMK